MEDALTSLRKSPIIKGKDAETFSQTRKRKTKRIKY
jgi:hypothetical protein